MPDWHRDEYESYVGPTLRLLEHDARMDELAAYFAHVAGGYMELSQFPDPLAFAQRFQKWYSDHWPESLV